MNGILNILKPPGMTSFDVVSYLRKISGIRKIGHAGTLDPGAAGVLPVCIGSATKAIEYMMDKDKVYRAELTLGIETDTQDSSGRIICEKAVKVTEEEITDCINSFIGETEQVPPMYSAVKVGGQKLYDLARKGVNVERKPRKIKIYSINVVRISGAKVMFDVACSKGTYIRTLCADIGQKLGCGGHMSFLVRKRAGIFDIQTALTLEEIEYFAKNNLLESKLVGIDSIFDSYRAVTLDSNKLKKLRNGAFVSIGEINASKGETVRIYDINGSFIAIADVLMRGGQLMLRQKKVFC
ncbi:MAG TPA: tRNA pseudouridine(55) synthase TruB [Clostridiaceae bacterium]|nr:tRNA pseudouridine(55) synthase TruB [Clostridiaceae bacterium]